MDQYTHGHHESVLRSHRSRTVENSAPYLIDRLRPGLDVLDVGCGPGTITSDLATRVSPGQVVGLDAESDIVDLARKTRWTSRTRPFGPETPTRSTSRTCRSTLCTRTSCSST